ncbi:hypothetical protein AJ90_21645 [Vibrio parahaemolyticus M0605]|nr:hypothetical protein AJ90_21645 [Vibrio parahaemolyticus M0605]
MNDVIRDFFKMESAGGILLVIAAAIAMTIANSPLGETYQSLLHTYVFGMSVSHWINDGLMAVFFLLIGLEVKRELLEGALKSKETAIFLQLLRSVVCWLRHLFTLLLMQMTLKRSLVGQFLRRQTLHLLWVSWRYLVSAYQ